MTPAYVPADASTRHPATVARVNGVPLCHTGETLSGEALRQRACTELLRQAAQRAGLLAPDERVSADGILDEAAVAAIDTLLERALQIPAPSEEACRRHHAANAAAWRIGERVHARHILFAVTPGIDVVALRTRAEGVLLDVRCHDGGAPDARAPDAFAHAAETFSNCPSGARGGDLGWLERADCAPEFARELFGRAEVGVLPQLVHSRFGLHVVEVMARDPGTAQDFFAVRGAVEAVLRQQSFVTALRQYLTLLAGSARLEGVELDSADTPLVQ